jgi:Protein of unknown function (DUF732)
VLLGLAACSSHASPSTTSATSTQATSGAPKPSTATLATQAVAPATYLALARPALPGRTDEQLIATAHAVCAAYRSANSYADAQRALRQFGLTDAATAIVIHASVIVYCPEQASSESSATALPHSS